MRASARNRARREGYAAGVAGYSCSRDGYPHPHNWPFRIVWRDAYRRGKTDRLMRPSAEMLPAADKPTPRGCFGNPKTGVGVWPIGEEPPGCTNIAEKV